MIFDLKESEVKYIIKALPIGNFLRLKYQAIASERGYLHAARLLRKQGYPLDLARAILL